MTTVLLQVSQGRRPCLEIIPEWRPNECDRIICMMKQCWDQEPRKRPQFSGADKEKAQKMGWKMVLTMQKANNSLTTDGYRQDFEW